MNKIFPRRGHGTSLAELPVTLWVFIFFLLLPFIDFVTLGYRAALAYGGVRDAATKGAFSPTFTQAQTAAAGALGTNSASFTGISYSSTVISIVQVDQTGSQQVKTTPWPPPINNADVYLIRVTTTASCAPLLDLSHGASKIWSCPGLTGPVFITITYQVASENPQGLTQ